VGGWIIAGHPLSEGLGVVGLILGIAASTQDTISNSRSHVGYSAPGHTFTKMKRIHDSGSCAVNTNRAG
jgi:hypothetical protein